MPLILLVMISLSVPTFAENQKPQDDIVHVIKKEADRTCQQDSDCQMSCRLGGVSKVWYQKNIKKISTLECLDGCAGWGHQVKCLEKKCTITDGGGKINKVCNSF